MHAFAPGPTTVLPTRIARRRRSGVSLLEVTFSIGVVMVGLLGVAALLPVAGILANRGAVTDAAARTGANATREFHVRSMADPRTWRYFYEVAPVGFRPVQQAHIDAGNSFCIDPRFIALGAAVPDHVNRNRFPFIADLSADPMISMPRITLATSLGVAPAMGMLQADRIFQGQDNLSFILPSDRTLGPVQDFGVTLEKRQLKDDDTGRTSWMATLVPKLDRLGNVTREYTLSVVVYARRVLDRAVSALPDENSSSERAVLVSAFYSGIPAVAGGDVQLVARPNRPPSDLEVSGGDWVMMSGRKLTPTVPVLVHKWYRVIGVAEDPVWDNTNSVWLRDVTLVGPDWDAGNLVPFPAPFVAFNTQVTICQGVVAVFEKTIRLETSSLWTY